MRNRNTPATSPEGGQAFDPDVDRYPTLAQVFRKILEGEDVPEGPVDRVEVTALATGEATYRVWPARAEEPVGGYLNNF